MVFAVCIFAIAEDGQRILVDHRASEDLMDCLKNKREAERKEAKRGRKKRKQNRSLQCVYKPLSENNDIILNSLAYH